MELAAAHRWGCLPHQFSRLPRAERAELLAYELERQEAKEQWLRDWPEKDWGRNLATLLLALD